MVLEGWEVKSLREGKVQLTDGYVMIRDGELFVVGCQINPLRSASTHVSPDSVAPRSCCCTRSRSAGSSARSSRRATRWCRSICTGRPAR